VGTVDASRRAHGLGQERDRREAEEAGFDAHLVKPGSPPNLTELLAEIASPRKAELAK